VGELRPRGDVASECGRLEGVAVVGDDGDGHVLSSLGIEALIPVAQPGLRLHSGGLESGDDVGGGLCGGDGSGQGDLGDVVDGATETPDATANRLELTEVGLPDAAATGRWLKEDGTPGPG
jgi:hypothetical protein